MSVKLQNGSYGNRQNFEADFRLMIRNCKTYNAEGTFAHGEAVGLEAYFEKGMSPCSCINEFLSTPPQFGPRSMQLLLRQRKLHRSRNQYQLLSLRRRSLLLRQSLQWHNLPLHRS